MVGKVVEPRWAVTEISVVGRAGMEAADTGGPSLIRKTGLGRCAHGL